MEKEKHKRRFIEERDNDMAWYGLDILEGIVMSLFLMVVIIFICLCIWWFLIR
jgi:hypothetical protein